MLWNRFEQDEIGLSFILFTFLVLVEKLPESRKSELSSENHFNAIDLIQLKKLLIWIFCSITGFAFVNIVALGNEFTSCFKSRHNRYFDIIWVTIISILLFSFTGNIVMYGQNDGSLKMCLRSLANGGSLINCKIEETTSNHYDNIIKNFFFFCVPFTIILHYFHLRKIKALSNINLKPQSMKSWTPIQCCVGIFLLLWSCFVVGKQFLHYSSEYSLQITYLYGCYMICTIFIIALTTFILKRTHFLHLHHYFLAIVFLPFFSVQSEMNLVLLALDLGMMIEGSSKWGLDPVWKQRKDQLTD